MVHKNIDTLKSLSEVFSADDRQKYFTTTLESEHSILAQIRLNKTVPQTALQLFETAKNLSLYSWFVYRFHQVAELTAFSALEVALRERYEIESPNKDSNNKQRSKTLYFLLNHAKKRNWISNEGFPSIYKRAEEYAFDKRNHKKSESHDFDKEPKMSCDEPTAEEIKQALDEMDLVSAVAENASKVRNNLAHGSSILHPNSLSTLSLVAEVINQLYE